MWCHGDGASPARSSGRFHALLAEPFTSVLLRFTKLGLFVHELLIWFEKNPGLASVKLTTVAFVEGERCPLSVRIRHHFSLTTMGVPNIVQNVQDFCVETLPYEEIGNGSLTLERDDPDVQAHLALVADCRSGMNLHAEYEILVLKICLRMDIAFDESSTAQHDADIPVFTSAERSDSEEH
jgi:hypothetical protein